MHLTLRPHPLVQSAAETSVEVEIVRFHPGSVQLSYVVAGKIDDLHLPPVAEAVRSDGLWRHTCFEAFVAVPPGAGYFEFNFAPSTQWAVYQFDSYRSGMRIPAAVGSPRIAVRSAPERYTLQATLDLSGLQRGPWRLGLCAVIEEASGAQSYWALAHPPGKPDFHHPDCFVCELPPP